MNSSIWLSLLYSDHIFLTLLYSTKGVVGLDWIMNK